MGIYRIGVLGVTFFLVALCPRFDAALVVLVFGLILYTTLWVYDLLKQKGKS